jgi:hypothetical protein
MQINNLKGWTSNQLKRIPSKGLTLMVSFAIFRRAILYPLFSLVTSVGLIFRIDLGWLVLVLSMMSILAFLLFFYWSAFKALFFQLILLIGKLGETGLLP